MTDTFHTRLLGLETKSDRIEALLGYTADRLERIELLLENRNSYQHQAHGAHQHQQPFQIRSLKLDFPRFDGKNILGWIFRAEQFFDYYNTPDDERLTIAAIHMDGDAIPWFQMMQRSNPFPSWQVLTRALETEFGPSPFDCPQASLSKLTQTSSSTRHPAMATLIAPIKHSPVEDAEALRKAVKGWGADEKAIIAILGHRDGTQRQQIRQAYQDLFQEDLIKRLESELSGDFERAMYRWILEPAERHALLANIALRNANKNYQVIVETACALSPEELFVVRHAYHNRHQRSLEEDVAANTSGHLRQLLVGLVSSFRYGGNEINARLAQSESDVLYEAIKDKTKKHEEVIRILTTRSKTQLVATFNRYRDDHGIAITKKLSDEAFDDFHKAAHLAIRCIHDHKNYYEKVLRNALKTAGTDEDALTRVIVTRAEKDLKDIKEVYYKRNSVHLEHAIAKGTSGGYKKFLLTLVGKED